MSDVIEGKGRCLCGMTGLTAKEINVHVWGCHCHMCRRWGGGPLIGVDCGTHVELQGKEHISIFNSSEWAERGFCNKCGTHLFYRLKEDNQYFIPAGLLEDDSRFIFDHQVFIDEKPPYYTFANKTEDMTGEEVFAKFGSSSE